MTEDLDICFEMTKDQMEGALTHMVNEFAKIRAGKANVFMLDAVRVDYYGTPTPLSQVANVSTPDPRTLTVQPWEKSLLDLIAKAIMLANLGMNPQNNGEMIIINIPPLTEERRKDLVRLAKGEMEDAKVSIRNARKAANDSIKDLVKAGLPEDMGKNAETKVQDLTNSFSDRAEKALLEKEKEIMSI